MFIDQRAKKYDRIAVLEQVRTKKTKNIDIYLSNLYNKSQLKYQYAVRHQPGKNPEP